MVLSYKLHYNIHWGTPEKSERLIFTWPKQVFTWVTNNDGKICKENLWRGNTELKLTKFHFYNTDGSSALKWQRDSVYAMWERKREEKKTTQNNKKTTTKPKQTPTQLFQDNTSVPTQACISNWLLADGSVCCVAYFFPQKF